MIILDGKKTSNDIKAEIAESVKEIIADGSRRPHLAAAARLHLPPPCHHRPLCR